MPEPKNVAGSMTVEEALVEGGVQIGPMGEHLVADFQAAERFQPKHEKLALLGKGAMGQVFIAKERDLGRTVAVKRIDPAKLGKGSDHLLRRFYIEAQITAQLEHPAIVPVYELNVDEEGRFDYSMKVVRGETLKDYLKETKRQYTELGRPDEDHGLADRLEIFLSVCAAMSYAHARGVIHRDLKPENIMLGAFHETVVMDWGLATIVGTEPDVEGDAKVAPGLAHETQMGVIVGTPLYMAPEQARGNKKEMGPHSDQVSLGLILYELVTLQRGYTGKDLMQIVWAAAEAKLRPVEFFSKKERVPRELKAVIKKACALNPKDRYPDVAALAADVRRFVQNEEVQAAPDGPLQKMGRWISRHRALALSLLLGTLLLGAVVTGGTWILGQMALTEQKEAAERRELALSNLVGGVSERAYAINGAFEHWTSLLTGMATAAEVALTVPPRSDQYFYMCREKATSPKDMGKAKVYFKKVSFDWLCTETAPGVDKGPLKARFQQLATLSPPFRRARLTSADPEILDESPKKQWKLVRDGPLPVLFGYMGLPEGIMATYPGRDTARDNYDPRKRPWYKEAKEQRGPLWLAIDTKSERKGLVVTGSMAARHPKTDELLGVTAVDVEMSYLIDRYLQMPEGIKDGQAEVFILNEDGEVLVQSSMRDVAKELKSFETKPFPHPKLVDEFRKHTAGHATAQGEGGKTDLVLWSRIDATHWFYAVVGAEDAILAP